MSVGLTIRFSSSSFPSCERDQELANADFMYGYTLARFIADNLPAYGFTVDDLIAEDWGWYCELRNEGYTLGYGCVGSDWSGDFALWTIPNKPEIRVRHETIDVTERIETLGNTLFAIIANSGKAQKGPVWSYR